MFKYLKQNKFLIISFLILLSVLCYYSFSFIQEMQSMEKQQLESIKFCTENIYEGQEYENFCINVLKKQNEKLDFYTIYTNIVVFGLNSNAIILFLFIAIPALSNTSKYFKNNVVLNEVTRTNYKKIKHKIFFEAYKSVLILPIIVLIGFIICYFLAGSFDSTYAILYSTTTWSDSTMANPLIFILSYLINVIMHALIFVNITLCIVRKHHNFFVAVILSFLTFLGIQIILEIVFGGILFTTILKSGAGVIFNLLNMLNFNDVYGIIPMLFVSGSIMIISFIVLHYRYKNKESLLLDCEFND